MTIDLVCQSCKHSYRVETESIFKDAEKNCPKCGSESYRQTFASFRHNGGLLDKKWADLGCNTRSPFG
jgi:hypothetical protein